MIISLTQLVDLDGLLQAFGIKVLRRGASADCRCGAAKLEKVISPRTHELWQSSRLMDDNFLNYQPWNLNPSLRGHRWVKTMTPPLVSFSGSLRFGVIPEYHHIIHRSLPKKFGR
jgi:hypothetical protein